MTELAVFTTILDDRISEAHRAMLRSLSLGGAAVTISAHPTTDSELLSWSDDLAEADGAILYSGTIDGTKWRVMVRS